MFRNKSEKEFNNRQKVFCSYEKGNLDNQMVRKSSTGGTFEKKSSLSVEEKIYKIFHSPNYIYKIDVTIVTAEGEQRKRLIGKNRSHLITIDNEYIEIAKILDIYV